MDLREGRVHFAPRGGAPNKNTPDPPPRMTKLLLGGVDPPPRKTGLPLGGVDPPPRKTSLPLGGVDPPPRKTALPLGGGGGANFSPRLRRD